MFGRALRIRGRGRSGSTTSWGLQRGFATSRRLEADFTHAVGGGAVGLAIARRLAMREGTSTVLIERNGAVGMETSSRNSEVIHAGLYYGEDTLKTTLCIQGREMMYELCDKQNIPYKKMGKWIVAQTEQQLGELEKLHAHTKRISVPTNFIPLSRAAELEPHIRATAAVLESPTTGILDSHAYMQHLLAAFTSLGGDLALHSTTTSLSALPNNTGYQLTTLDATSKEETSFTTETLVNSAGLSACHISNLLLPPDRHVTPYYAKGNYYSYTHPSSATPPIASRLIYPAPVPGLGGLGTHLTLDIAGNIRFGPDVEWVSDPTDLSVLSPDTEKGAQRLAAAVDEIRKYFPGLEPARIAPDYAGVRPKLRGRGEGEGKGQGGKGDVVDFVVRAEDGFPGFVNLLGIESPGLTASLAIAERVEALLYR